MSLFRNDDLRCWLDCSLSTFYCKTCFRNKYRKGLFYSNEQRNGESSKLCILRATALVIGYTTPCTDIDIHIYFFIFYLKDILQSVIGCPLIKKKQKKGFPEFVFYVQTGTSCMKWLDNAHMRLATAVANSFFYIPIYIAKANSKKALKLFVFFLFFFCISQVCFFLCER